MSAQRILFIHSSDPADNPGGGEASLIALVSGLNREEFAPIVAISGRGIFEERLHAAGVETVIVAMNPLYVTFSEIPKLQKLGLIKQALGSIRKLKKLIRREKIEMVITNVHASHIYGGFAARGCKVPHVMYMRDLPQGGFSTKLFPWLADKYAARIIAISESVAEFFKTHPKHGENCRDKVSVVHNGIDTQALVPHAASSKLQKELAIENAQPVITLVGRLQDWKGQLELIQASAQLVEEFPQAKILLVGETFRYEPEYRDLLDAEVNKLNLEKHIVFTGQRKDIAEILAASDIAVSASWHEPFGRVIVEAMALGLPLVATRAGGAIDIVIDGKTGYLVQPKDPIDLAQAILKLARNSKTAQEMGRAGRARAEKYFDTQIMVKNASEVLQAVLDKT